MLPALLKFLTILSPLSNVSVKSLQVPLSPHLRFFSEQLEITLLNIKHLGPAPSPAKINFKSEAVKK